MLSMMMPTITIGLVIAGIGVIAICCLVYYFIYIQPVPVDAKSNETTLDPDIRPRYTPREQELLRESDLSPDDFNV